MKKVFLCLLVLFGLVVSACEPEKYNESTDASVDVATESLPIWRGQDDCAGWTPCATPYTYDTSVGAEAIRERNGTVRLAMDYGSCSGTLLTPQLVLTAAHCFDDATPTSTIEVHVTPTRADEVISERGLITVTPPAIFRGPPEREFGWQDLALVQLMNPERQAQLKTQETGINYTVDDVLTWGYPVTLRKDPMVNLQHAVELAGYGVSWRDNAYPPNTTLPDKRQRQFFPLFSFMKWDDNPMLPQMLIRAFFDEPYDAVDRGDSGGPLFVVDNGKREQAGVALSGCAPNRVIDWVDSVGTLIETRVPVCTSGTCPGGFVDLTGACSATADKCCQNGTWNGSACILPGGGIETTGYFDLNNVCQLPPMFDGVVLDIQPCDGFGLTMNACPLCQLQGAYFNNWLDVTSGDARNWILSAGADPQRPGHLFGERDYNGYCRSDVDANCDRWIDPVDSCPAIFDSGAVGGFYPPDYNRADDLVVYAARDFSINDRARVYASDGTLGTVAAALAGQTSFIRNDARVGQVISPGDLWFGHRYTVESIAVNESTTISTQDGRDLTPLFVGSGNIPQIRLAPQFPSTVNIPEVNIEPGQQYPPTAGERLADDIYIGVMRVKSNATLKLGGADGPGHSGKYYFNELVIEPGGKIEMNHPNGHTEIHVRNSLIYNRGQMVVTAGNPYATLVTVSAAVETHVTGTFKGTLVTPMGSIVLDSSQHFGAFYAGESVTLHQGGRIYQRPLVCE